MDIERRLAKRVRLIPVHNGRRLEDYLRQARTLKIQGSSLYNSHSYVDVTFPQAFVSLSQYKALITQLRTHSSAKEEQHRGSLYKLNQDLLITDQILTEIKSRLSAASASTTPEASIEIASGPKELLVPQELIDEFICLSDMQTEANIETLGILAGTLDDGKLVVKGLVLPKQHGVSDMCECLDDEQLFNALLSRNWMDLGWIHTHPNHNLFLSSVDLHTHACKQQLLPEAIALVWAPQERPSLGVFHLTDTGMSEVMDCKLGGFHPHNSRLFQTAAHVKMTPGLSYSVVPLWH
jgi:STAM-binding protein